MKIYSVVAPFSRPCNCIEEEFFTELPAVQVRNNVNEGYVRCIRFSSIGSCAAVTHNSSSLDGKNSEQFSRGILFHLYAVGSEIGSPKETGRPALSAFRPH